MKVQVHGVLVAEMKMLTWIGSQFQDLMRRSDSRYNLDNLDTSRKGTSIKDMLEHWNQVPQPGRENSREFPGSHKRGL